MVKKPLRVLNFNAFSSRDLRRFFWGRKDQGQTPLAPSILSHTLRMIARHGTVR
jgi:hypothetical protein